MLVDLQKRHLYRNDRNNFTMSEQEDHATQSSPIMVPSMDVLNHFLHDASSGKYFSIVIRQNFDASMTHDKVAPATQSLAKMVKLQSIKPIFLNARHPLRLSHNTSLLHSVTIVTIDSNHQLSE